MSSRKHPPLPRGWRVLNGSWWGVLHHPHGLWSQVRPPPELPDFGKWREAPPELAQGICGLERLRRQGVRGAVEWERALEAGAEEAKGA